MGTPIAEEEVMNLPYDHRHPPLRLDPPKPQRIRPEGNTVTETPTSYTPTFTTEIKAMGLIETAMRELADAERWRIARWVADRWQQPSPPKDDE
jgi:hypothetical protein